MPPVHVGSETTDQGVNYSKRVFFFPKKKTAEKKGVVNYYPPNPKKRFFLKKTFSWISGVVVIYLFLPISFF